VKGSYTGVVGLPVLETAELLRAAGIEPPVELKDAI
jgi:predicted house-cleaning NTP pyrophosphatase (Maf/HAM1 superfamily)